MTDQPPPQPAERWKDCRKGSCQRHQESMSRPCLTDGPGSGGQTDGTIEDARQLDPATRAEIDVGEGVGRILAPDEVDANEPELLAAIDGLNKTLRTRRDHDRIMSGERTQTSGIDVLARLSRELAHPVMHNTGSGEVEASLLEDAGHEIGKLRDLLVEARIHMEHLHGKLGESGDGGEALLTRIAGALP